MKHRLLLFALVAVAAATSAQVAVVTRAAEAYKDFKYSGTRLLNINEAGIEGKENNVFLFSKAAKGSRPDTLYLQRYTKEKDQWSVKADTALVHDGVIINWDARKGFFDGDQDGSVDAYFVYSLADTGLQQQSVHLLLSKNTSFYSISASASDRYQKTTYSGNFKTLPEAIRKRLQEAWEQLDKE
ncbi:hypothetical protein [Niabella beijingensis]|uniref:hypothetical protein n=1 Tax=Niabella beijingensis TaxID=2872700 RepID=UPI001CBD39D3|nr:hypothetical protein [Niabella beijingensis]MBZ4188497.1 hypothetical protein [Niabella beijingensis]